MKRNTKKEKVVKEESNSEEEEDKEEEEEEDKVKNKTPGKQSKKKSLNWSGIFILLLFVVPTVIGGLIFAIDYLYPQQAIVRKQKERLVRCYNAANPSKVSDVDYLMKKYEGNEAKLFGQLREKYSKFPECQIFP